MKQQQHTNVQTSRRVYSHRASHCVGLLLLVLGAWHTLFSSRLGAHPALPWLKRPNLSYDDLIQLLLSVPQGHKAREWSTYYTSESHLPGQGLSQAEWTRSKWEEFGIVNTTIAPYEAYCSYPEGQRLALLDLNKPVAEQVLYEADLVEYHAINNPGKSQSWEFFAPAFHAFSAPGNVTASYVFANFGTQEDYETLMRSGISLEGKIAIVKSAQVTPYVQKNEMSVSRFNQIQWAQRMGILGVIAYADPEIDGSMVPDSGYAPFPDGPARPETMIERGALTLREETLPGDSGSDLNGPASGVTIPSIPISYADAIPLLRALNGHGPSAYELPPRWNGGRLGNRSVLYNVGPSPENIVLNFYNGVNYTTAKVHNVIGTIQGRELPDEVVIVGNHRDAWGPGAGDPNSGSTALNEVVRSFGAAMQRGWRPLRTIVFISFDGEEFGQVGSRPWIREHLPWLNRTAVAYLNVVVAAGGTQFHVKTSPMLHRAATYATGMVQSPNQTVEGQTVLDVWGRHFTVGGGGDAMQFLSCACISALDMGFSPGLDDSVFPYHSQFDTVEWMDTFGDPDWKYHITTAKIWSLMAVFLLERPVLAERVTDYAISLGTYLRAVRSKLPASLAGFDFTPLHDSIARLNQAAVQFDGYAAVLDGRLQQRRPWWDFWTDSWLQSRICTLNQVYIAFERMFCHEPGLDGEPWSKHAVFSESAWHKNPDAFPALGNALSEGNSTAAYQWVGIIADRIDAATSLLERHLRL
ncbi:hypothetical protein IFM5058_09002 [Aspergillus udagawae]|nr:hypothetical protein IFM5058_09002 [Aspergillus udagawae]